MHNIRLVVVFTLLGVCSQLADADCYPGDIQFTAIVQEIYKKVTSDRISGLRRYGTLTRSQLCWMLVRNYNYGKNPGQTHTNNAFLAQKVSHHSCYNALVYTNGYDTSAGWKKWAGTLSGTWWSTDQSFSDGAKWHQPYVKYDNRPYAVQKVEFYSQWRKRYCTFVDQTGATCRYGWNQSGKGIQYVWGWDPKNNNCPYQHLRGRTGAHVGFTFNEGKLSCIVWVTTEEAFLECVRDYYSFKRRTSCNHDDTGYGQWFIS